MWNPFSKRGPITTPSGKTAAQVVGAERFGQVTKAGNATALRAIVSQGTTVAALSSGAYWAGASMSNPVIRATVASAVGISVTMPVLMPALIGVLVATLFILRQKGLNEELATNLYFIKMEVERMYRIHNVMKDIADEKGINLHTTNLANCMKALQSNILKFSSKETLDLIKKFEYYLSHGEVKTAEDLLNGVAAEAEAATKRLIEEKAAAVEKLKAADAKPATIAPEVKKSLASKIWSTIRYPFRTLPTGFTSRWLSPDETLRQIIRDITIAIVWFSIMLGEQHIFELYMNAKQGSSKTNEWIKKPAFKDMLLANRQLASTTPVNSSSNVKYKLFYKDLESADSVGEEIVGLHPNSTLEAVKGVTGSEEAKAIQALPEQVSPGSTPVTPGNMPKGGTRRLRKKGTRSKRRDHKV